MKTNIRNKRFIGGILIYMTIILILTVVSSYYIHFLLQKTNAILTENHYSVTYSRNMSKDLVLLNKAFEKYEISKSHADSLSIQSLIADFRKYLRMEQNNITEVGEDELVNTIITGFAAYILKSQNYHYINGKDDIPVERDEFVELFTNIMSLSSMNERAIELKTNSAKSTAEDATFKMSIVGACCFLVALLFSFALSSFFNEKFYRFYNDLKEIKNEDGYQQLYVYGNDEFTEMSLIINELIEKTEKLSRLNDEKNVESDKT